MDTVLLILFAIFVFAVVGYLFAARMREEPAGRPRWLWLAGVAIISAAGALSGLEVAGPRVRLAVMVGAIAVAGWLARAGQRAAGRDAS